MRSGGPPSMAVGAERAGAETADAVVVLGAAVVAPGVPGPAMKRRVAHAARVLADRRIGHLVVSGGKHERGASEAEVMRRLALDHGVPEERIVIEDRSRNTFENAVYTGRIILDRGWSGIVVVTDAWHMRRALFVCRRLGLAASGDAVPRPADVPRRRWLRAHCDDTFALAHSAWLFAIGADKPLVAQVLQPRP